MIDTDKYEGLTIDDWYKMNHHDWKDVVNEHNDLLAEVKRLREQVVIDTDKYEPTSNCGNEECNDGYDCEDKKCTHAYVDYYKGEMVFHLICKSGFEWKEIWTYKGGEWLD